MLKYILFKNVRGTTKLNLQLSTPLNSLADLTNRQARIINYIMKFNNYNFTLASDADTNAITLEENVFNDDYIFNVVND